MSRASTLYPLTFIDPQTGESYRLWPWQADLRVERTLLHSVTEGHCVFSFFADDGEFRAPLKNTLPLPYLDWAQTIPLAYRQALGRLNGEAVRLPQLLILRLMKHYPLFKAWILQLADSDDGAYLRLVWQCAGLEQAPLPVCEQWLLSLPGQKRHELLGRLLQIKLNASQALKTRKLVLDEEEWALESVRQFFAAWLQPDLKQTLLQAQSVRVNALGFLIALPHWLRIGALWRVLSQFNTRDVSRVLPPLILEASPTQQALIVQTLKKVSSRSQLEYKLFVLVDKLIQLQPFPAAPYPGNARLIALDSAQALQAEGKAMQHCVGGYVSAVVRGEAYFYHWTGDQQVTQALTLQLAPFAKSSQWTLVEALGRHNCAVDQQAWLYLHRQLAKLNPPWGYLLVKTAIVGLAYADYARVYERLQREMVLDLIDETDNPYDAQALRIDTPQGDRLGYVPKSCQAALLPYRQQRARLRCRLNYIKPNYATVNIYLAP
ncbi:MAG: PcfJ domain-containing protein [Thiomicrospira sp.]|jgi:hypothetical protein|nr:PcfJ domain-containing protein [Thiomicrospira sp.]